MVQTILLFINLALLEISLSIDNAAVLAVMVKNLPISQQQKALRYGIIGAFAFRGASLFLASWLVKIFWLKFVGALYLLYLVMMHFKGNNEESKVKADPTSLLHAIILVEFMDMSFSIDNIFAAVALTSNIYVIWAGVFIGIIAMRFVAGWFVKLIYKHPTLETSAYVVIGLLAFKLFLDGTMQLTKLEYANKDLYDHIFSALILGIFFLPLLFKKKSNG